jgi:hypothetical protein
MLNVSSRRNFKQKQTIVICHGPKDAAIRQEITMYVEALAKAKPADPRATESHPLAARAFCFLPSPFSSTTHA